MHFGLLTSLLIDLSHITQDFWFTDIYAFRHTFARGLVHNHFSLLIIFVFNFEYDGSNSHWAPRPWTRSALCCMFLTAFDDRAGRLKVTPGQFYDGRFFMESLISKQ